MADNFAYDFDVIVVGGGHAGVEAAYAASRMGSKTLLITLNIDRVGAMPCNPAIGGIGKGHIVFEISALGGLMPKLCSKTYLQARMLNTSKGPAVHGLRLQIDKFAYNKLSKEVLEKTENLTLLMSMVDELIFDSENKVSGIKTREGASYTAKSVVITTGTFLNGLIHIGNVNYSAGRQGEEAVANLSRFLAGLGLKMGRLKTGTPPRLLKSSLDFSKMDFQDSDDLTHLFEFHPHEKRNTVACYITHTNSKTHEIIKKNFHLSPIFTGHIKGTPPRYCPSIEDKISRFADKDSHHVFVEPEGENSQEIYPNGLSTSLPLHVQKDFIRTIKGFEDAILTRAGYAVEYDYVFPNQLKHSLEVKFIPGLFLAGQINGTTGYEEAAGQGIIAGINAHQKASGLEPFILDRTESYIGIMIDDLVTLGVDEPYRMFTSRAERRLILRQDNVFTRLADKAHSHGLISTDFYTEVKNEDEIVKNAVKDIRAGKNNIEIMRLLSAGQTNSAIDKMLQSTTYQLTERAKNTLHAEVLYEPYLKRETREIDKTKYYQALKIPITFNYKDIPGLSIELQQKLAKYRPESIAQASLIQGITPAAISLLIFKIQEAENRSTCIQ